MRRHLAPLLLAVLALITVWLMQHDTTGAATRPAPSRSAPAPSAQPTAPAPSAPPPLTSPRPTSTASSTIAPPADVVEPEGTTVDPTAAARPRDRRQAAQFAAYTRAATVFMTAFARPSASVPERQWWAEVASHLDVRAAAAYEGTDPQAVPFTVINGPVTILPTEAPSELLTIARVPTDAGWYRVEMTTTPDGIRITAAIPETSR